MVYLNQVNHFCLVRGQSRVALRVGVYTFVTPTPILRQLHVSGFRELDTAVVAFHHLLATFWSTVSTKCV